jgi:hypothetical protein
VVSYLEEEMEIGGGRCMNQEEFEVINNFFG